MPDRDESAPVPAPEEQPAADPPAAEPASTDQPAVPKKRKRAITLNDLPSGDQPESGKAPEIIPGRIRVIGNAGPVAESITAPAREGAAEDTYEELQPEEPSSGDIEVIDIVEAVEEAEPVPEPEPAVAASGPVQAAGPEPAERDSEPEPILDPEPLERESEPELIPLPILEPEPTKHPSSPPGEASKQEAEPEPLPEPGPAPEAAPPEAPPDGVKARSKTSQPPPPPKKKQDSLVPPPPPPPPPGKASDAGSVDMQGHLAPPVMSIPEDDVPRDYKVRIQREAMEAAAEMIPPEFMSEVDSIEPDRPRPRPKRPVKPKRWYEEIFGDEWLRNQPRLTAFQLRREIEFVEKGLGLQPGAMVLDLACGVGVHAIGLAKRGYNVVGLDLSVAMLAIAGEDAQQQELKINFLHGDMRDLQFGPTFDGVYCIGSSFGYFNDENNLKVLEGVHRALKPGGLFLLEVENRDFALRNQPNLLWYEGDGHICMEETTFDFISSRLGVKGTMLLDEGGKRTFDYSIRVYSLHELGLMLHNAGFSVHSVGGHRAEPARFLGEASPRIIISAQKLAEEG